MCDPLFSRETSAEYTSKPNHPHSNRKKLTTYALQSKNQSKKDQDSKLINKTMKIVSFALKSITWMNGSHRKTY